MADFAVLTKKYGVAKHLPSVLMNDSILSDESRNVHERDGYYESFHRRVSAIYDADGEAVACPQAVYAITGVNTSTGVFTIAGNHASTIGTTIRINGSTGNDTVYTVASPSDVAGDTEIPVEETIADATVDGNLFNGAQEVLRYHLHKIAASGTEYFLLATAYHIFLWTESSKTLTVKYTCATPASVTHWSLCSHRGDVYASNNVDLIQVWDADSSAGDPFDDCDTASGLDLGGGSYCTKAKYLASFEGYLFVAFTTVAGTVYGQEILFDDGNGTDTFDANDAGMKALITTAFAISGIATTGHEMVFFKTEGPATMCYLNTDDTVFSWYDARVELGCLSEESIINVKNGDVYWLADDLSFRSLMTGNVVMDQIDRVIKKINREYASGICAAYMADQDTILVGVPYMESTTNNLLIEYRIKDKQVYLHDIPVASFGGWYGQSSPTYTLIGQLYDTYNDWGAAWANYHAEIIRKGEKLLLVADTSGYTYELRAGATDAGGTHTTSLVFDTTINTINEFKRLNDGIELIVNRATTGTLNLYYKLDGKAGYALLAQGTYSDAENPEYVRIWIPCDIRAKHFRFKIETTDYIEFIAMIFRNFEFDGDR